MLDLKDSFGHSPNERLEYGTPAASSAHSNNSSFNSQDPISRQRRRRKAEKFEAAVRWGEMLAQQANEAMTSNDRRASMRMLLGEAYRNDCLAHPTLSRDALRRQWTRVLQSVDKYYQGTGGGSVVDGTSDVLPVLAHMRVWSPYPKRHFGFVDSALEMKLQQQKMLRALDQIPEGALFIPPAADPLGTSSS